MHKRHGFTIVELAVALVIIGILLTIGVVSLRSMQATARDKEREADVQTIANSLESLYPQEIISGGVVIKKAGSYPSRAAMSPVANYDALFGNLPRSAQYAPDNSATRAFIPSTQSAAITNITAATITPTPTTNSYIYSPLLATGGATCDTTNQECRSFQIYYKLEFGEVKIWESKRR